MIGSVELTRRVIRLYSVEMTVLAWSFDRPSLTTTSSVQLQRLVEAILEATMCEGRPSDDWSQCVASGVEGCDRTRVQFAARAAMPSLRPFAAGVGGGRLVESGESVADLLISRGLIYN